MKKTLFTPLIILVVIFAFPHCGNDKINDANGNESLDITRMLTPNGKKLQAAEEGPVRSALGVPQLDLADFQLEIAGLVDSSFTLNWDEILAFPSEFTDTMLMYCVEGWEVWGNWKGILVKDLLEIANIQHDAEFILFTGVEGYTTSLPISYLEKYNALLAYEVNGVPLEPQNGFPLRLIAFGKYGYKWAKWVNKLEIINQSQIGYWEGYGYSDTADVPLNRRKHYEGQDAKSLKY